MPSKIPQYTLRIPGDTLDKLKYIADHSGRSANREIEQIILAHIKKWEQEHGPISFGD